MALTTNTKFPSFQGPTRAFVPTPTFSGRATSDPADSINPYTMAGPGDGGIGQTYEQVFSTGLIPSAQVRAISRYNTAVVDESENAWSLTITGSPVLATDTPHGDGMSLQLFNETIAYPQDPLLEVGAAGNDFTAEAWVKLTSSANAQYRVFGASAASGWSPWMVRTRSGQFNFLGSSTNGQANFGNYYFGAISLNTWYHVAITREGVLWRGFVNGIKGFEQSISATPFSGGTFMVGGWQGTSSRFRGRVDDLRFTIGTAIYTEDFTPPGELPLPV
jgi:hypothetical protein